MVGVLVMCETQQRQGRQFKRDDNRPPLSGILSRCLKDRGCTTDLGKTWKRQRFSVILKGSNRRGGYTTGPDLEQHGCQGPASWGGGDGS